MMSPSLPKTEDQRPKTVFYRSYDYWDRDEPKGWLTALVVVLWLALFLWLTCFAHCAETRPLVHADFYAAERLLLLEGYPGRVISGAVERRGAAQTLTCELLVAPGKVETVIIRLIPGDRERRGVPMGRPDGEPE